MNFLYNIFCCETLNMAIEAISLFIWFDSNFLKAFEHRCWYFFFFCRFSNDFCLVILSIYWYQFHWAHTTHEQIPQSTHFKSNESYLCRFVFYRKRNRFFFCLICVRSFFFCVEFCSIDWILNSIEMAFLQFLNSFFFFVFTQTHTHTFGFELKRHIDAHLHLGR